MTAIPEIVSPWSDRAVRITPVDSDNMEPGIRKGDFVLGVPADKYEGEGIYIFNNGTMYRVRSGGREKRLLLSDNPLYRSTGDEVPASWLDENVAAYVVAHLRVIDGRFLRCGR